MGVRTVMRLPGDIFESEPTAWPVFRLASGPKPLGMACLTELLDRVGRNLFGGDWPSITDAPPKKKGATLLTGKSDLSQIFPEEERLDPAWNEMIKAATLRLAALLYSASGSIVAIDVNGDQRLVPPRTWMSSKAVSVISRGWYKPDDRPDTLKGRVYAPLTVLCESSGEYRQNATESPAPEMPAAELLTKKLIVWLEETARARVNDDRLLKKEEFLEAAKTAFPKDKAIITRSLFEGVWRLADIDPGYKKPGRRQT